MAVDVQCDRCRKVFFWSSLSRGALPRRGDIYCAPCAAERDAEARRWRARIEAMKVALSEAKPQEAKPTPSARAVVTRADGSERRRTTVYFPPTLAKQLVLYCAENERELSAVVAEAVERWLEANQAQSGNHC